MSKFEELLLRLEQLGETKKRIEEDSKLMEEMIDEIKEELIKEMPTDNYSNAKLTLSKIKDLKLKIKLDEVDEQYLTVTPVKKAIKEAIKFGIAVKGVEWEEVERLDVRFKKNVEED